MKYSYNFDIYLIEFCKLTNMSSGKADRLTANPESEIDVMYETSLDFSSIQSYSSVKCNFHCNVQAKNRNDADTKIRKVLMKNKKRYSRYYLILTNYGVRYSIGFFQD